MLQVKANIVKVQEKMKTTYDAKKKKGCKVVTYKVGDQVLRKNTKRKQSGSVPAWSGPFTIRSIKKTMVIRVILLLLISGIPMFKVVKVTTECSCKEFIIL